MAQKFRIRGLSISDCIITVETHTYAAVWESLIHFDNVLQIGLTSSVIQQAFSRHAKLECNFPATFTVFS